MQYEYIHYEPIHELTSSLPTLMICPNCGEHTVVCKSERKCINQPFGPPLPVDKREYRWTHTAACNVIKLLKKEISDKESKNERESK